MIRQAAHSVPGRRFGSCQFLLELRRNSVISQSTILLVERREGVFTRLAAELAATGFRVAQARDSREAIRRYVRHPTDLLMVNADQGGESAWLLAAKLRLTHPAAHIWVYMHRPSAFDVTAANLLMIDELIEHGGSMCRLTAEILDRLEGSADWPASPRDEGSAPPVL